MSNPTTEQIQRRGRGTGTGEGDTLKVDDQGPAAWGDVEQALRAGSGTTWLSVRSPAGVHTRPIFAAWTGTTFVFASKSTAVKTRYVDAADDRVTLAIDLGWIHLVLEGSVTRLTTVADLERASVAMSEIYDWPTTVVGQELDAPYGAPTSGGPPYRAYGLTPSRAFAFPTDDQVEPTRFTW